jgi:hypothetical protein
MKMRNYGYPDHLQAQEIAYSTLEEAHQTELDEIASNLGGSKLLAYLLMRNTFARIQSLHPDVAAQARNEVLTYCTEQGCKQPSLPIPIFIINLEEE